MTWSAKLARWLSVADVGRAVDFYKSAFSAVEPERLEGDVGLGIAKRSDPAGRPGSARPGSGGADRAVHVSTASGPCPAIRMTRTSSYTS